MELPQMLTQMCRKSLTDSDIRAIAKARGFAAQETASRAIFESFYLSDIGVAAAMATLSPEELALLHLLAFVAQESDVSVLERVYTPKQTAKAYYGYETFTQRYGEAFKKAQASLVRKGVLVYAEYEDPYGTKTKLERMHIRFPKPFERHLPPLLKPVVALAGPAEVHQEVLRDKLCQALGKPGAVSNERTAAYPVAVVGGDLQVGQQPFQLKLLREWQAACWEADAGQLPKESITPPAGGIGPVAPTLFATHALSQLAPGAWVAPEALDAGLKIFCYGGRWATGQEICTAGWQWGILARHMNGGQWYYRLADSTVTAQADALPDPATYLHPAPDGTVAVVLRTVPYAMIEQMALMATFTVVGANLVAAPHPIKIGNHLPALRDRPLMGWLREHAPAFRQAWDTAEARWGKQIIHEGLLVARVTDPALRVQIERALTSQQSVITLSDEYLTFPAGWLHEIERIVVKAGYVIKTVKYGEK